MLMRKVTKFLLPTPNGSEQYQEYQRTQGQIIQTRGKNKFKIEFIFKPNNK